MALSRTDFITQNAADDTANADFVMSAITTVDSSLLILAIAMQDQGGGGTPVTSMVPSAVGLSFTSRKNQSGASYGYGVAFWTAPITIGAPTVITIDVGAVNVATLRVRAACYTGYNTGTPIGATAGQVAGGTDGLQSTALSGAPATDSEVFACLNDVLNSGVMTVSAGAGWTELDQVSRTNFDCVQWQIRTASTSTTVAWADIDTGAGTVFEAVLAAIEIRAAAGSASVLSAATPSGTLGTTTTVSLGATTDQTTGTFYGVVDSAANLSGVTGTQVKAGQKASGAAAAFSGNSAVSTSTPSIPLTGLTPGTLYSYAVIQNNANGDSNVLTGTFTTAAVIPNPDVRSFGAQGFLRTLLNL